MKSNPSDCSGDKIPSAFIITGPNIASQDLLFEQLSDSLQKASPSKFIRLRSSEATNLKNALKKIIQDATSKTLVVDGEEDLQIGQGSNRRYLPYDLEALHEFLGHQPHENIFVAFQDSEGFDSGLLSDIITLLRYAESKPGVERREKCSVFANIRYTQLMAAANTLYSTVWNCYVD